ncbi:MAG TPA: peptidase, partial [Flavisolibacter sp.]
TGAGKNLNWFWKRWFFDGGFADLAIRSVVKKGKNAVITVTSKGTKPVPVDLTITYADNSTTRVHRSIAVWEKGNSSVAITVPSSKAIRKIVLGSTWVPDANKGDNIYNPK